MYQRHRSNLCGCPPIKLSYTSVSYSTHDFMETTRTRVLRGGVTIHYRLLQGTPRRPLLILLHGMASNLTRWSEFVEHTSLTQSFDILRIDLRGHGESFTRARIGMEIWRQDLADILDAEGYERAVFIGHSLGANVALHFTAWRPTRVTALVLIDPVLTEALRGSTIWIRRLSPLLRMVIGTVRFLNRLGLHRRQVAKRDLRKLDEDVRTRLLETGKEQDFVKRYTSPLTDMRHFPIANYLQELIEITRPIPAAEDFAAPILALISQAVTFTDTDATQHALRRYPTSRAVMLSAYHWPLTEKPVEVRREIELWCAQLPGIVTDS